MVVLPPRLGLRITIPVLLSFGLYLFGQRHKWSGVWALTDSTLDLALLFGLPAAAGASAWTAATLRHSGILMLADHSTRRRLVLEARLIGEMGTYVAVAVVVATVTAWSITWPVATTGQPDVLALAPRVAIVLFFSALGYGLGRRLPLLVAVPLTTVVPYVAIGASLYFAVDPLAAVTPIDDRVTPFSEAATMVLVLQALTWGALLVGALLFLSEMRRRAMVAVWVSGMLASPLILMGTADRVHDPGAAAPACATEGAAMVCLPRALGYLSAPLAADLDGVIQDFQGLAPTRAAWIEPYVEWGAHPQPAWQEVMSEASARGYDASWTSSAAHVGSLTQVDTTQVQVALVATLFAHWTVSPTRDTGPSPNEALLVWALDRAGLPRSGSVEYGTTGLEELHEPGTTGAEMAWFQALTDEERREFFLANREDIRSGDLDWSAFG